MKYGYVAHRTSDLHINKFLFSGKELQDASIGGAGKLGLYDFHPRYYNPTLGRWFTSTGKVSTGDTSYNYL